MKSIERDFLFSDYSGPDNPNSFYGEFSICSDGPANFNQYEKIGRTECFSLNIYA